jgi:hypothetical protein
MELALGVEGLLHAPMQHILVTLSLILSLSISLIQSKNGVFIGII